jgi:hypothetical protein
MNAERIKEPAIYVFNVQATGIADDESVACPSPGNMPYDPILRYQFATVFAVT